MQHISGLVTSPSGSTFNHMRVSVKTYLGVIVCSCLLSLLASCSSTPVATESSARVIKPVSCVAVLPARAGEGDEVSKAGGQAENVRSGAAFADSILRQELASHPRVRMVQTDNANNLAAAVAEAGTSSGCGAVMVTSVYKFRQRVGSTMAVDEPASTAFDLRIYDPETRHVLWAADFSETQQTLLSNLFSFGKAQSRGFQWVTVEELLSQGLKERLAACPYLQTK